MKLNRSLTITFLLLIVFVLSISSTAFAQDPLQISMTWWGSQSRHDRTIAVIEAYEAANPGICQ